MQQSATRTASVSDADNERRLVARAIEGDRVACRELFDAHATRIYHLIYRLVGDEDLAQDFTQDTFIRAFSRLRDYRAEAAFGTWLYSVAMSVTLNGIRREKRHKSRKLELHEARDVRARESSIEPDLRTRLYRAIDELAEIYRVAVVLHDIEGYTHVEIAELLGIPEGTSKARLSVARAKLRETLAKYMKE